MLSIATLFSAGYAQAATSPSLGLANPFGILSGTYTNTMFGTTINGDLGYTTGPAVAPTVNGATHVVNPTYTQAGIDQGAALTYLSGQTCTFTFPAGAVDLASNLQFPTATYSPGVYCIDGAASVGTGGITLSGTGTYIFRMTGALDTVAASVVTLASGASECVVWWTPTAATTLGANSTFRGTVIDAAGITIGSMVTWVGRALGFGGTVTTDVDTITAPSCAVPSASLTVTKTVVNDDNGTLSVSDFSLFVNGVSVTSGVATTTLAPGTYTVSETGNGGYEASGWGGDCAADGSITLADGDVKTCTVTNNDVVDSSTGGSSRRRTSSRRDAPVASSTDITSGTSSTTAATDTPLLPANGVPRLPNAGFAPVSSPYGFMLLAAGIAAMSLLRKKRLSERDAV